MEDKGITLGFETDLSLFFVVVSLHFQSQRDFSYYYFAVALIFFRSPTASAVNFDK